MNYVLIFIFSLWINSCRSDSDEESVVASSGVTVSGVVKSSGGSQAEMASWIMVFVERDSGVAQYGVLGSLGNYEIANVRLTQPQTIVLLDPQYRLAAVTTSPGDTTTTVRQYFTSNLATMPSMVHQGPVMKFSDISSISFTSNSANDTDADLIPDGMDSEASLMLADTDSDGLDNNTDFDIDGDGIINWFDDDDDGDTIADVYDSDANGNEVADLSEAIGEHYFSNPLDFIAVQVVQEVQSDSSLQTKLILTAKISSSASVSSVAVSGASALFTEATSQASVDDASSLAAWDGLLLDDGLNEDGNSGDLLFAKSVNLATGRGPKSTQVIFFTVTDSTGVATSVPYSFPTLTSGAVSGAFDVSTDTVTKSGTPFGTDETYTWSVHIFDALGTKIYGSESIDGAVNTFSLPDGILDNTQTYTAQVVASTIDRINSYPTWTVKSTSFNLN